MSKDNLHKAFDLIDKYKNASNSFFAGPVIGELIDQSEKLLNICFPKTYKEFIKKYGCGDFYGDQYYGLISKDIQASGIPNTIWVTLDQRKLYNYPKHLIIIADTGDGYWYSLDSSKPNEDGEYPVVIYYDDVVDEKDSYEKINEDFGDFLLQQVATSLEQEDYNKR